uniref:2-(3-amino-3-carboxypropyl)histidine synthase subunit 2 n=1 Tax=Strigamia maritima TaxID=126957 RepID=T1JHR2_STRMM
MTSTVFSSSDSDVINRKTTVNPVDTVLNTNDIEKFYEIDRCIKWITENNYKKIALQFPDEMLPDSTQISLKLRKMCAVELYILGDTSYGSCCADEIAAEHASADSLIHFGHSCLSITLRLPVLYIYGKKSIDIEHANDSIKKLISNQDEKIILIYDVLYTHAISELKSQLISHFPTVISSELEISHLDLPEPTLKKFGRRINLVTNTQIDEYIFIYIGKDDSTLANFMLSFNQNAFYSYDPQERIARRETLDVNRTLMKRYYLVERTRDANIVGILVGTLGVANYLSIISHLKSIVRKAGKKAYTLAMGKINVAKLANFPEIDVVCLVACPENSMVDSKEFLQPIVTPYEVELACNPNRTWTGDYISDFTELLPGASNFIAMNDEESSQEPTMSLVTGSVRALNLSGDLGNSKDLILRNDSLQLASIHQNAAGEFLNNRSWTGLQQNLGETEVVKATKGRSGIACEYENETGLQKKSGIKINANI